MDGGGGGGLGKARTEVFAAILLDGRMRKLREVELCRGGRNAVSVLPRDVLEPALREGASAVILVHNHPSGDPAPSEQDVALTQRMAAAAELLGLAVTDHVIVGDGRYASMAELGLFEPAAAPGEGTSWASARGAARALRGSR